MRQKIGLIGRGGLKVPSRKTSGKERKGRGNGRR